MHIEIDGETIRPEPLRTSAEAVGGGQALGEIVLAWYDCDQDVPRLRRERPDVSGELIEQIITVYQPLRLLVEPMLTIRLATHENTGHRTDLLRQWLDLAGLENPVLRAPGDR